MPDGIIVIDQNCNFSSIPVPEGQWKIISSRKLDLTYLKYPEQ